ncbi:MAG TPA: response regulator [Candidatus Paceibacterota bacterium]|nr:response regulator [Candidatus Paceibacterota bacterium]
MEGSRISIVVIESSEIVRERIIGLISRLGNVEVMGADTGIKGLTLCLGRPVNAVVVGLETPDINGMKLLQQLRVAQPAARIIALTNCAFKGILQLSLECGADFCFDKMAEFQSAIDSCKELADQRSNEPPAEPIFIGGGDS